MESQQHHPKQRVPRRRNGIDLFPTPVLKFKHLRGLMLPCEHEDCSCLPAPNNSRKRSQYEVVQNGTDGADPSCSQLQEHLDTRCSVCSPFQPCGDAGYPNSTFTVQGRTPSKWGRIWKRRLVERGTSGWEEGADAGGAEPQAQRSGDPHRLSRGHSERVADGQPGGADPGWKPTAKGSQ